MKREITVKNAAEETSVHMRKIALEGGVGRLKPNRAAIDEEMVHRAYSLPVTRATQFVQAAENESLGGELTIARDAMYSSLTQHAQELGQFPMDSFMGYGALQVIQQNGMIRNCIKTVADDMTREWIEIKGGEESEENVEKLKDLQESKYHLRTLFNRAASMTGFMGGCFIYIDTDPDRTDDQHDPSLPLAINDKSAELTGDSPKLAFRLVDPVNVAPSNCNTTDPLKGDYMVPEYWHVMTQKIHNSRLLRVVDNEPPTFLKPAYNFLGIPQAQILWDYVLHWNDCRVSGANLMRKISLLVYKTDFNDCMAQPNGLEQLDAQIAALQRYRDNSSVFVCDKEDEMVNIQTSVSGVTDLIRQAQECISAINRTPAVKLFGISPSGFNATGESDIRNYYDHIASQQELKRDAIQACLNCIQLVEFGKIDPSVQFDFVKLYSEDTASDAMTFSQKAQTALALKDRNIVSGEEVRKYVKMDEKGGFDFLSDDFNPDEEDEMFNPDDPLDQSLMRMSNETNENENPAERRGEPRVGIQGDKTPEEDSAGL